MLLGSTTVRWGGNPGAAAFPWFGRGRAGRCCPVLQPHERLPWPAAPCRSLPGLGGYGVPGQAHSAEGLRQQPPSPPSGGPVPSPAPHSLAAGSKGLRRRGPGWGHRCRHRSLPAVPPAAPPQPALPARHAGPTWLHPAPPGARRSADSPPASQPPAPGPPRCPAWRRAPAARAWAPGGRRRRGRPAATPSPGNGRGAIAHPPPPGPGRSAVWGALVSEEPSGGVGGH